MLPTQTAAQMLCKHRAHVPWLLLSAGGQLSLSIAVHPVDSHSEN